MSDSILKIEIYGQKERHSINWDCGIDITWRTKGEVSYQSSVTLNQALIELFNDVPVFRVNAPTSGAGSYDQDGYTIDYNVTVFVRVEDNES